MVLVSTIAGGAINTFVAIKENPLNVVNMLAETLPKVKASPIDDESCMVLILI